MHFLKQQKSYIIFGRKNDKILYFCTFDTFCRLLQMAQSILDKVFDSFTSQGIRVSNLSKMVENKYQLRQLSCFNHCTSLASLGQISQALQFLAPVRRAGQSLTLESLLKKFV